MKNTQQIALVKAELEQLDDNALINAWNEYARESCSDDELYENNEEFFETYFTKPIDAVRAVAFGDYRYGDDYVKFDGYANLKSFNHVSDHIDFDSLADYVWDKRLDCIEWDELEEAVAEEFRAHCEANGLDEDKFNRFMDEEFDWEGDLNEMIGEALKYE